MNYDQIKSIVKQYRGYGNPGNAQILFMDYKYFVNEKEPFTEVPDTAGGKERLRSALNTLLSKYPHIVIYFSIYDVEENGNSSFIYSDEIFIVGSIQKGDITNAFECSEEYIQPSEIFEKNENENISALIIDGNGEVTEFQNNNYEKVTVLWWD